MRRWSEPRPGRVRHSQWEARDAGANEISGDEQCKNQGATNAKINGYIGLEVETLYKQYCS